MPETSPRPNSASLGLVSQGTILLIQRAHAPYQGLWTFPGGRLEPGETAAECAARELFEEVALIAEDLMPVETQSLETDKGHFTLAVFASTRFSGTLNPSNEVLDAHWVGLSDLDRYQTTADLELVIKRAFAAVGETC
ncbi:hypothetical protein GCM10007989_27410 [Devosia pacifica]|uniref:Nudix hydrolase domain-containing protein n=1 Tax=Devosia pacifica TaxID=1335967 RepID=A0A918S9S6_9HYPH|nr:NUDIX domain-containing protein [Devosia pacifica]GHA30219.1 hypothetical protein GCM10007989_27410 [Devosia pacifica]